MRRQPRVLVEGLIYHVYNRVGRGEAPFKVEDEAGRFWSLLHEVKKRDGLAVLAWCITVLPLLAYLAPLVKALADALGRSCDGVSQWVRRGARRRAGEPAFARRLNEFDRKLAEKFER